jgi:hypothetical protein
MGGIIGRTALSWRPPEALRRSEAARRKKGGRRGQTRAEERRESERKVCRLGERERKREEGGRWEMRNKRAGNCECLDGAWWWAFGLGA